MADAQSVSLGKRLRQERELRQWTQEELAEKIGRSVPSINRWEHDRAEPQPDALKALTALFGKPPDRWGTSRWNVPFLRNPYFTGRKPLLSRLHSTLAADKTVALSQTRAISGLGGLARPKSPSSMPIAMPASTKRCSGCKPIRMRSWSPISHGWPRPLSCRTKRRKISGASSVL